MGQGGFSSPYVAIPSLVTQAAHDELEKNVRNLVTLFNNMEVRMNSAERRLSKLDEAMYELTNDDDDKDSRTTNSDMNEQNDTHTSDQDKKEEDSIKGSEEQ